MSTDLRVIDSIEEFESLREDWDKLHRTSSQSTIFLSWDWMFTWWEVFHKTLKTELLILCLYEGNELVGIAPFQIIDTFPKSLIQGKTLCFIGSGEAKQDKIVSQYMDFIIKPDAREAMISTVSNYLLENKKKWNFADFEFLLKNSVVSKCFQTNSDGICTELCSYGRRFFISEIESHEEFQAKMGGRWRKMFRKKHKKLESDGDVTIQSSNDIESAKANFYQLAKMHEARWKQRTKVNIFQSDLFTKFHIKILERLVTKNKACISTLCLDEQPLATYYYFQDKNQVHYYQSGFYTENANRYSPLFLLVCKEIMSSISNKYLFDFMFDENISSYKKEQYAADSEPMYRLKWSTSRARMNKHKKAKIIQEKLLRIKSSISKTKLQP